MSEPTLEWADRHALTYDYDLSRWIQIPAPELSVDIESWAEGTARAWAEDLGRTNDRPWLETLRAMLETAAGQRHDPEPDALFMNLSTPPMQAPSPELAALTTWPADESLEDFAGQLADSYAPGSARPPILEQTALASGLPAWLLTVYLRDEGDGIRLCQHLVWQIHEFMIVNVTTSGYDAGRILEMTDDVLGLAAATSLVERPDT